MISEEVETNPNDTLHISKSNIYEPVDSTSPINYRILIKNK